MTWLGYVFKDFAELRALNHQIMTMEDWLSHVNKFLAFSDQEILENAEKISREMAVAKAHEEQDKFRVKEDELYISDFDKEFEKYLKGAERQ